MDAFSPMRMLNFDLLCQSFSFSSPVASFHSLSLPPPLATSNQLARVPFFDASACWFRSICGPSIGNYSLITSC